ncbi:oligopeptide/dipeptide ABC transporter ATP-binding protein [Actinocorallia herbida]|uniref:Oligopeptide/dipeptide ABC transporter ATP-binding protein n=1 Tax=Actinocorallia herbida TaxID=58109 RepID=A0A3N1CWN3_9ACTN|nr:ABC transporter ATP-binding protein [Actinocorallia herbida]ROO85712.1 oligopeptide/dipeptide ABC transporter ATP-binding protein [Actinocorallia herbida]
MTQVPVQAGSARVVELEDVDVVYRTRGGGPFNAERVHALTGVGLTVAEGETVGIVGESGCGKSTLAKVLVGLERPRSGEIRHRGQDLWRMSAGERRRRIGRHVGMVFQDPSTSMNRRMPVRQILRDPLDVHRWGTPAERDARVAELLSLVGLPTSAAGVLPSQLSGGQRQRVAIARALALGPDVLIADEPTSALDVSVRAQILNLLLDLKSTLGLAMIYISHDIQTVRRVSDRILTMYLGRVVEETPAASVEDTRHPYTRALLSATPSLLHSITPIPLTGPVPSAVRPPSGCPFRTRCWRADDRCAEAMPEIAADHSAAAHRYRCFHPVLGEADLADARAQELS